MKLEICSFSGYKIYPGRGKVYVRLDSRTFRLLSSKVESLFLQRKNPRKVHWTTVFRKMHKKGITEEEKKKRSRKVVNKYQRAVVGLGVEELRKKRTMGTQEREKVRAEAVKKAKEQKKAEQAKKKELKAAATKTQSTKTQSMKNQPKRAVPTKPTTGSRR